MMFLGSREIPKKQRGVTKNYADMYIEKQLVQFEPIFCVTGETYRMFWGCS
jgi:hypothetical protein